MKEGKRIMFKLFQEIKSIKWIYNQQKSIDFSPAYQRHGDLWKKTQQQLLIDSILNKLDIPKFYFQFMPSEVKNLHYNYAIIDGKQRIEAILGFINDKIPLSNKFSFLDNSYYHKYGDISGKRFSDIERDAPALIAQFWQFELSIVFIDTTTPDIINELFIRLNSGIPVSTTEKRNANGGILSLKIQELCDSSDFFTQKIKLTNRRFAQNDLALKLLMLEMGEWDLTKKSVDKFLVDNKNFQSCSKAFATLKSKINYISEAFEENDYLLSKKNIIITLYTVIDLIPSTKLRSFMQYFENHRTSESTPTENVALKEFTRLLQQGADKKSSIQERSKIMKYYINKFLNCN